jgi:hypothetical protein
VPIVGTALLPDRSALAGGVLPASQNLEFALNLSTWLRTLAPESFPALARQPFDGWVALNSMSLEAVSPPLHCLPWTAGRPPQLG